MCLVMQSIIIASPDQNIIKFKLSEFFSNNYNIDLNEDNVVRETLLIDLKDKKKNISIDQIRELIVFLNTKPVYSKVKIVIVSKAQTLSEEAQNALLKILEEPPNESIIVLCVDHKKNLLPTIVSRCKVYEFEVNDLFSSSLGTDQKLYEEILSLFFMNEGQKIDWFIQNKEKFKERDFQTEFIYTFDMVLRDLILYQMDLSEKTQSNFKDLIEKKYKDKNLPDLVLLNNFYKDYQIYKKNLIQNNINFTMTFEYLFLKYSL